MNKVLYIIPNLKKVSGGPNTRISCFKQVFIENNDIVYENGNKASSIFKIKKHEIVYIESATNRISLLDFFCLFFLRLRTKKMIVFIRDIYIELFPEEFTTARSRITLIFNRISNFYLSLIATNVVFPTLKMGEFFFAKNKLYKKRPYTDLPPGTYNVLDKKQQPNFNKKRGILYLGNTTYTNSGFSTFLNFEKLYNEHFNFFILSGDKNLNKTIKNTSIELNRVQRNAIPSFITKKNIAYAFHTRPRNIYDDLTFPIKVFDFLSFQLPFITEKHKPLEILLSNQYQLFASMNNLEEIYEKLSNIDQVEYTKIENDLKSIALTNTYDTRYKKLLNI